MSISRLAVGVMLAAPMGVFITLPADHPVVEFVSTHFNSNALAVSMDVAPAVAAAAPMADVLGNERLTEWLVPAPAAQAVAEAPVEPVKNFPYTLDDETSGWLRAALANDEGMTSKFTAVRYTPDILASLDANPGHFQDTRKFHSVIKTVNAINDGKLGSWAPENWSVLLSVKQTANGSFAGGLDMTNVETVNVVHTFPLDSATIRAAGLTPTGS